MCKLLLDPSKIQVNLLTQPQYYTVIETLVREYPTAAKPSRSQLETAISDEFVAQTNPSTLYSISSCLIAICNIPYVGKGQQSPMTCQLLFVKVCNTMQFLFNEIDPKSSVDGGTNRFSVDYASALLQARLSLVLVQMKKYAHFIIAFLT